MATDDRIPTYWFFAGALILALAAAGSWALGEKLGGSTTLGVQAIVLAVFTVVTAGVGVRVLAFSTAIRNTRD